ncbi:MAG: protoporphyrinogen oxidase HemJ [Pseudomonadota bacterium]
MLYEWMKALHVMAWASWMAGMFYLPRLFVYHAEHAAIGSETSETFKMMERKLLRLIMNPAMVVTWITGLWLAFVSGVVDWSSDLWIYAKLVMIIAMTWVHHLLVRWMKSFREDRNRHSGRFFRIANEVPTLLFVGIVVMAIVKPF